MKIVLPSWIGLDVAAGTAAACVSARLAGRYPLLVAETTGITGDEYRDVLPDVGYCDTCWKGYASGAVRPDPSASPAVVEYDDTGGSGVAAAALSYPTL